jgi:hypothetical protein
MQIDSAEHLLVGFYLLYWFGLHQIVDKKTAIGGAGEQMRVLSVEKDIDCGMPDVVA